MEVRIKHYLISGRVQGVGFRAFTAKSAKDLGLKGWVRNLNDGRVEAVAAGDAGQLARFEEQLRKGPAHGRVDSLTIGEWKEAENFTDFAIRRDL